MAIAYSSFDTTPSNLVADLKTKILLSTDWANITGNIVKATTTRGAQMVVDLSDAAATATRAQLGVYRTHDGTTGVDKVVRYISWRSSGGATSDTLHVRVSAGKEHLYIDIEGPRGGETNAVNADAGSARQCLFIGDLVPYHASDTTVAVCMFASTATGANQNITWHVSRNQGNTSSWVPAFAVSMMVPLAISTSSASLPNGITHLAAGDGKAYMWPYVIVEQADGMRGRVAKAFFCGFNVSGNFAGESLQSVYGRRTYNSETYMLFNVSKGADASTLVSTGFGVSANSSNPNQSPLVAIPIA